MKGVLLPIRIVVVLLLLFPFYYSQANTLTDPICTTVEGSGKKYEVCLTDVTYDYNAGTSTWTYTARTIAGNDISHFVFGIPCGTQAADYSGTSGCGAIEYGNDPTTGVEGIKFDCGANTNGRTVSFTINGLYSIGIVEYAVKTGGSGQKVFVFDGFGPSCTNLTSLPDGSACANAVEYLSTYGLITIEDLNTNSDVHYNVFVGGDLVRYPGGGDYLGIDGVFSAPTERSLEVAGIVKSGTNIKYSGAFTPPSTNTITKINSSQYQVNGYAFNLNTSGAEMFYDITLADKAAQIKSDLEAASAQLANAVANNVATGNLTFNVNSKDANGVAVFHIDASDIAQNANVQLNNNVNANTIIINVSGTNVDWTNGVNVNIAQSNWSKVLWNFPEAGSIAVNSLKGIVLAPFATFSSNSANEGAIAVKTYNGDGEIHRPYFAGDFSSVCALSAPEIQLNLTAECKVGNTLYWRVTGDDDTDGVAFSWNGPGGNDGNGTVDAGERAYFTTQDAGGSNTTVLSWFDPSTGSTKTKTKSHSNRDCVYHVEFEKEWVGASAPNLTNTTLLTAESSVATATCGYDGNGNWYCDYEQKSNGASLNDLEVPFGETYSVSENTVNGWITAAGIDENFEYVEGFDTGALPDALVYQLSSNAYATPIPGGAAKYGMHTVENTALPGGSISPLCVSQGETYAMDFDTDDDGNTLDAGTGIGTRSGFIQPYANLFGGGEGVTFVSGNEFNKPLSMYDSEIINGDDPDLQRNEELDGNWATGNLTDEILGNLLIINQTSNPAIPDDNAQGGQLIITSDVPLQSFAFDIVDLENVQNDDVLIFENTATGASATVRLSEFLSGSGSPFSVAGVTYGERSANRITGITATKLGIPSFDKIILDTDDSFGIGAICVEKATQERSIGIKVFLQGGLEYPDPCPWELPVNENEMTNILQQRGLLPTTNPYGLPETYNDVNDENAAAGMITDWVLIQLRDGNNPSTILEEKAGLLQVDGDIVDENGDPLTFNSLMNPVYIVVKHRNHLTISSPQVSINNGDIYDFTTAIGKAFGVGDQMVEINGVFAMWGGDVNGDGQVYDYGLSNGDPQSVITNALSGQPFAGFLSGVYSNYDANLDGDVFDFGLAVGDVQWIITNSLAGNPYATFRVQQIPFSVGARLADMPLSEQAQFLKNKAAEQSLPGFHNDSNPSLLGANVFPNPNSTSQATIELNDVKHDATATIILMNMNGQVLQSRQIGLVKGFNQFTIETGNLPQGTYLIKITGTDQNYAPIRLIRTNR